MLDDDKILNRNTVEMIREVSERGVKFTIATGRMSRGALRYADELGVDIPVITYNGAIMRSLHSNEVYREYKVPAEQAKEALSLLADEPVLRYAFLGEDVFTDTAHEWTDRYADLLGVDIHHISDVRDVLGEDPTMLVFMVPVGRAQLLTQTLKSKLDSQVRVTNSADWFLDVLHPQATKGLALAQLAECLGIEREEVIAIGDNGNDIEMVEYAGLGVAVANATDELKAVADYITEAPISKGVEEVIQRFIVSNNEMLDTAALSQKP
jgi:hypothetical protein